MKCIFCELIKMNDKELKKIEEYKLWEDKNLVAFLDKYPVSLGHTLIFPKKHYKEMSDIPESINIFKPTKMLAEAIKKITNSDGYNIHMNNSTCAGQVVPHVHVHITQRKKDDEIKLIDQRRYKRNKNNNNILVKKIKKTI